MEALEKKHGSVSMISLPYLRAVTLAVTLINTGCPKKNEDLLKIL